MALTVASSCAVDTRAPGARRDGGVAAASTAAPLIITGTDIGAGDTFSCALMGGEIRCWGANAFGQLADDTVIDKWAPVVVHDIADAEGLGIGAEHACAVRAGGELSCWGRNSSGQLGDGTTSSRDEPVTVSGLGAVSMAEGGLNHTCVVSGGSAYCWGDNGAGKLGDNTVTQRLVPTAVQGLTAGTVDWVDPGDSFTCAVAGASDTVFCWGLGSTGQLGVGSTTTHYLPQSTGLTSVLKVSAGSVHACALLTGGGVKCWGNNGAGRLGDGTTTQRTSPVDVKDTSDNLLTGFTDISAGASHTCGVSGTGEVYCWGLNSSGQLGTGDYTESHKAKLVPGIEDAVNVSAGEIHTCAMRETGQAVCWGNNGAGRLGDGYVTQSK